MAAKILFSAALLATLHLSPANSQSIDEFKAKIAGLQGGTDPPTSETPTSESPTSEPPAEAPSPSDGGPPGAVSKAVCFALSRGYSKAKNAESIAKSVADVSAYVCSDGPKDPGLEVNIATATAEAYALAVTHASTICTGEGNVEFYASAYAKAVAEGNFWLKAYAEAFAQASTCDNLCSAVATSYGYVEKEVFLKAVAESEATVNSYSIASEKGLKGFQEFIVAANSFDSEIVSASATAFAKAIAGAKEFHEEQGCFAWVNAGGCIWTPDHPDPDFCVDCTALSIGATRITEIDALAEAVAAAGAFTCGNDTEAVSDAYVAASALAEATAEALSFAYASCDAGDGAFGCSASLTAATDTAYAVAEAFATAWAGGLNCEETCIVESESATAAIGGILVTAVTDAFAAVCAENGESWSIGVLAKSIETGSVEAVAQAIASAVVDSSTGECFAATLTVSVVE